jgi:hypothetical protein
MFRQTLALSCIVLATTASASAQPWRDAYARGDYDAVAAVLQPVVANLMEYERSGDPEPASVLATMFAQGRGVERDPILACALARAAAMAARMAPPNRSATFETYRTRQVWGEQFEATHCSFLSEEDRQASFQAMGCYGFGLTAQVVDVGPYRVYLTRSGPSLEPWAGERPAQVGCFSMIAGVRVTSLLPPGDAAPDVDPRHFVELFGWQPMFGRAAQPIAYGLAWIAYEIAPTGVLPAEPQTLVVSSQWPRAGLPQEIASAVSMEMIRSGHVRWRIADAPPRRGWIMRPSEEPR